MKDNKEVNINVRVTKDFKNKLTSFCEQMDISNSVVVRRALATYFQNEEAADLFARMPPISGHHCGNSPVQACSDGI
jgi:antitoxin component of RelBE/YafQ-DinJ toxin-antitoxin module